MPGIPGVVVCEDIVIDHPHVVRPLVGCISMLGAAVVGLDRIEELKLMDPSAVHCHGRLELEILMESDGSLACEEETVCLLEVALGTCQVLKRRGKVLRTVEIVEILPRVVRIPDRRICRCVDHGKDHACPVRALSGDDSVVPVMRICHVHAYIQPFEEV